MFAKIDTLEAGSSNGISIRRKTLSCIDPAGYCVDPLPARHSRRKGTSADITLADEYQALNRCPVDPAILAEIAQQIAQLIPCSQG
jgi:hypothetical protein